MQRRTFVTSGTACGVGLLAIALGLVRAARAATPAEFEVTKTEAEWRALLTPEQYRVLREAATEPPFRNEYFNSKVEGIYQCAGCDRPLFASQAKYDSGTGWPSFWEPIGPEAIATQTDWKLVVPRTEVHCSRCGGHLGHVFRDGPAPTGLRYCMNSAALKFVPV
jgi:peptide-methionine (R)-S-oxide reductase